MYSQDTHYSSRLARSEISLVYWMLKRMHSLDSGTFVSIIWQEGGSCIAEKVLTSVTGLACAKAEWGGKSLLEAANIVKFVFLSPLCGNEVFTGTNSNEGTTQNEDERNSVLCLRVGMF